MSHGQVKRQRYCSHNSYFDRLPDDILLHILSFMLTRDCVRSSTLGKRWRLLWALVPNLKFDSGDHKTLMSFSKFFNKFVFKHKGQNINTFRFKHDKYDNTKEVKTLIATAMACNVQVVDITSDFRFKMPQCIFTCKTLVDLTLCCFLEDFDPTTVYLPALKKLKLERVRYESEKSIVHLLSGCPALEELTVLNEDVKMVCFCVSSPTLIRLDLGLCDDVAHNKAYEVKLDTPALKYLKLHDYVPHDFSAGMLASLKEADVVFDAATRGSDINSRFILKFVSKLNNVSCLKLKTGFMEVPNSALTTQFRNLTILEFDGDWRFVTNFLEKSDKLEVITISSNMVDGFQYWSEPRQVPVCLIHHLGTVRFDTFKCTEREFNMVRYILRNAYVLKRMEIDVSCTHCDLTKKYEALKRITLFERAPEACQLVFNSTERLWGKCPGFVC